MRVTSASFTDNLIRQLNLISAQQQKLQLQASTGQRIQNPEDDPAAVQQTLDLNAQATAMQQYSSNITTLQSKATSAFDVLKSIKTISDRAGEIATLADGTKSPDELHTYGTEVTQLIQQAAQLMNTKFGDVYLFGGTQNQQAPFSVTTGTGGVVTGVSYQGNANVASSEIAPGQTISVDTPGENNSGNGPRGLVSDSRVGADLFNHLISLQNHLMAGDSASVASTDRPALNNDEENLLYQIGNNGAIQTRLDAASSTADTLTTSYQKLTSQQVDADMATTLVQLNQTQTAYQAALQSGAVLMQKSLLDYLP